jgi:diguanylate cyclase (GGDEF)-like protein
VIGRIGGEEFVVLAPDAGLHDVMALAERIRATVERSSVLVDGQTVQLTVSIGVTVAAFVESDFALVLRRADAALYAAKRAGRNLVRAADAESACEIEAAQSV